MVFESLTPLKCHLECTHGLHKSHHIEQNLKKNMVGIFQNNNLQNLKKVLHIKALLNQVQLSVKHFSKYKFAKYEKSF